MKKKPSFFDRFLAAAVVLGGLYALIHFRNNESKEDIKKIMAHPVYSTGVLVEKRNFKGTSGTIDYIIDGAHFSFSGSLDSPLFATKQVGDTVSIIYEKSNPENVMLKYDKGRDIYQL